MPDPRAAPPCTADLLADAYRRLAEHTPALRVTVLEDGRTAPPGWLPMAELPAGVERLIEGETLRIQAEQGRAVPAHVAGSRLLHHYLWSACLLASGPWYLERRVPDLPASGLWIEPATGDLALRPAGFACLPDDPAAGLPGVRVAAGEEDLRADLLAVVAGHAEPVLAAFAPALRRGRRALAGMLTDDLLSGIWYLGRMLGEEEQAVAEATALLPAQAAFRHLAGTHPTRTRQSCCLYYAVAPTARPCLTCPRTPDTERLRRMVE